MKKLAILILLSLFVFVGCQDDNSILAPNNDYASEEMTKGRPILGFGEGTDGFTITADTLKTLLPDQIIILDEDTGKKSKK